MTWGEFKALCKDIPDTDVVFATDRDEHLGMTVLGLGYGYSIKIELPDQTQKKNEG